MSLATSGQVFPASVGKTGWTRLVHSLARAAQDESRFLRSQIMPVRGSLKKGQLGFSMPAYAPLFPKPPYFYKNATLMVFKYVTNESAARMVPDVVELA